MFAHVSQRLLIVWTGSCRVGNLTLLQSLMPEIMSRTVSSDIFRLKCVHSSSSFEASSPGYLGRISHSRSRSCSHFLFRAAMDW